MTEIYLHFRFAHYGLYGNAPVLLAWFLRHVWSRPAVATYAILMRSIPCDTQLQSVRMHQQPLKWGSKIARGMEGEREAITTSVLASAVQCRALMECTRAQRDGGTATATGACTINLLCAQKYVGKYQSCMVISGRLILHAPGQRRPRR